MELKKNEDKERGREEVEKFPKFCGREEMKPPSIFIYRKREEEKVVDEDVGRGGVESAAVNFN